VKCLYSKHFTLLFILLKLNTNHQYFCALPLEHTHNPGIFHQRDCEPRNRICGTVIGRKPHTNIRIADRRIGYCIPQVDRHLVVLSY